jgi:CubicO group peptidase (beta-lactamase class C family)
MLKLLLFPAFVLIQCSLYGQSPNPIRLIDSTMQLYAGHDFSGVVLVAKGSNLLYHKAFGEADKEKHIPNKTSTRFNLASLGKTFTATMIMQLVDEGKLRLAEPIGYYLPEFRMLNADKITIHHLLTHTSGFSNYMLHPAYAARKAAFSKLDSVMTLVTDMPLSFNVPGESWRYSNSGYIILGKLIEKVTGKSYLDNLNSRIFNRCGIKSPPFPREYKAPATAVPYFQVSAKRFINESETETGFPYSDGGIQCSAHDVYQFALAICENKLLSANSRALMLHPHTTAGRGTYGYGWTGIEDFEGKKFFGHSGGTIAFSTELRMNLENKYIVVVLSNIPVNTNRIVNAIMSILYRGTNTWLPKKPLANIIFEIVDEKGIDYLKENLDTIMKRGAYPPFPNAGPLIPASEMLTKFKQYDKALQVLNYAASRFPNDWGPYNGMGDTYKAMGNTERAIEAFQKALTLNPKDEYAMNQLKLLQQLK